MAKKMEMKNMFEKIWNRKTETTETKESLTLELKTLTKQQSNIEKVVAEKILVITALSADPRNAKVQSIQEEALTTLEEMLVDVTQKVIDTQVSICRY
jgi:hypothetical protein